MFIFNFTMLSIYNLVFKQSMIIHDGNLHTISPACTI
jgi:hypothetical protein